MSVYFGGTNLNKNVVAFRKALVKLSSKCADKAFLSRVFNVSEMQVSRYLKGDE